MSVVHFAADDVASSNIGLHPLCADVTVEDSVVTEIRLYGGRLWATDMRRIRWGKLETAAISRAKYGPPSPDDVGK